MSNEFDDYITDFIDDNERNYIEYLACEVAVKDETLTEDEINRMPDLSVFKLYDSRDNRIAFVKKFYKKFLTYAEDKKEEKLEALEDPRGGDGSDD